ncbi:MAG: PIN domain-containing protein [archaeon]
MTRYYIDACIWRDYFEDRKDRFRPLGDWAFRFIKKIVEDEDEIIISDVLIKELDTHLGTEEVKSCLSFVPKTLIKYIKISDAQERCAHRIKQRFGINFNDSLHVVLAKDHDAILITRDKHFEVVERYVCVRKPEDLL